MRTDFSTYRDEELVEVTAVTSHLLLRVRGGSRKYRGGDALHTSRKRARGAAEKDRARGTSFVIRENPSLLLTFTTVHMLVASFHPGGDFANWQGNRPAAHFAKGTLLPNAVAAVTTPHLFATDRPLSHDSFVGRVIGIDELLDVVAVAGEFRRWESRSKGGRRALEWEGSADTDRSTHGALHIARAFREGRPTRSSDGPMHGRLEG
ncbi:hypothetical protein [Microbacterium gubbeenense]|uniref:hypothetical protein n=1 Tax=Microbacterium gubbeenense TaxID=159896 RepID=UPI003F9AEA81